MYKKRKNNYRKKCFLLLILFMLTALQLSAQTTDEAPFNFEDGELHGFTAGTEAPIIENDTSFAYAGSGSMKVTMETAATYEVILNSPGEMAAGTPIDMHIYLPSGMVASIQPFILDANWGWNSSWVDKNSIPPDTWMQISVLIPQTAGVPINRLGIQIFADTPGTIWIDSINFITEVAIDKSGLEALLLIADDLLATAIEGEGIDEYAPGSIALFEAAVSAARAVYDNADVLQTEVDDAVQLLESALANFLAAKNEIIPPTSSLEILDKGFLLTWDSLYADGLFTLSRSLSMAGPYTAIAENTAETTYTDNDILEGKTYFYTITVSLNGFISEPSTPVYRKILRFAQLQDLPLFKESIPGGWSGGDTGSDGVSCIEVTGSQLPIDQEVGINGLPSLRLNIIKNGSWWVSLLAGPSWNTYNLESYYENGSLEFNIKGAVGGEDFSFGFFDKVPDRDTIENGIMHPLSNFGSVTQEWQRISIPLKDLIDREGGYKLKSTTFIRFEKNWGAPEQIFRVWLNDICVTSPDNEKSFAAIKVNQVGYTTKAEKYALVSAFEENVELSEETTFKVKKANTGEIVYCGTLKKVTDLDEKVSGEMVYTACFTRLQKPGNYYISVNADNVPDSYTFGIGNDIFDNLIVDASRYFYFQRANMALEPEYAGEFAREDFTPGDFSAPLKSDPYGERRDVSGGWYDAGDFGKYTNAGAMAISDLLWAYELYPGEFRDNQFTIPESGNGTADILDEIQYELEFFLRLQDTDGGFFHRVYPGTKETENNTRYIDDVLGSETHIKPTSHSGAATGVLAHAALVYAPVNEAFSARMLNAAVKGWEYLEAHPDLVPSLSGAYNDNNDTDERFYAAAALFKATGEAKYNDYVKAHYKDYTNLFINPGNAHSWGSFELTGFFHYAGSTSPDPELYSWFKEKFANWRGIQLSRGYTNPWRNTLREYDYYWGSNLPVLCTSMDLIIGSKLLGTYNSQVVNVARSNLNYVLGINPMAFSYVSGYGENSLTEVFSGIYSEDEIPYIPDGYLAGGANMYQGSWFSRFNGKCYNDVNTEWTTNEHTIYWNSGLVFSAAFAAAEAKARSGDIETMIIYPEEWIIGVGETTEVIIAAIFNGCTMDIIKGADVTFEVLRPEVASITPGGVITGLKPGIAFIKADITYGNYSQSRKFFVLVK